MDRFHVVSNAFRDPDMEHAKAITSYLKDHGKSCEYCSIKRQGENDNSWKESLSAIKDDTQCAIVLGGDGTIIQVAGVLARRGIPLIGANLGHLGFLAEISEDCINESLDSLMADNCSLEERMMLKGCTCVSGELSDEVLSLNDIVFTKRSALGVVNYDVFVNDKHLTTICGDGVIVSTPTGSTGYSMSAGGPIVEPDSMVILVTPVSSHNLNSRPIVLSANDEIKIKIANSSNRQNKIAQVLFDGGAPNDLCEDDFGTIRKAEEITRIYRISRESFIEILSRKLS